MAHDVATDRERHLLGLGRDHRRQTGAVWQCAFHLGRALIDPVARGELPSDQPQGLGVIRRQVLHQFPSSVAVDTHAPADSLDLLVVGVRQKRREVAEPEHAVGQTLLHASGIVQTWRTGNGRLARYACMTLPMASRTAESTCAPGSRSSASRKRSFNHA